MTDAPRQRRRVFFVRHGLTPYNEQGRICGHAPIELSKRGQEQAQHAGQLLGTKQVDVILASPLRRAAQTAEIINQTTKVPLQTDDGLTELRLEGWAGKVKKELKEDPLWRTWKKAPHTIATPEGERLDDVGTRAMGALCRALLKVPHKGGIVVVSHGGVVRVLLLQILGMPLSSYQKLRIDCGSVSTLDVTDSGELILAHRLNER